MVKRRSAPSPEAVAWLGYGGLIPFVALAVAALLGGSYAGLYRHALVDYGAVILSFVGALHWAFAMTLPALTDSRRNAAWTWSVVPALLGWLSLLLPLAVSANLLSAGFIAQFWQDARLQRWHPRVPGSPPDSLRAAGMLPDWYLPLRARLSAVAVVSLALGVFAANPLRAESVYRNGTPTPDGIGKFYDGREIAQVMGFDGAPWLDRPERDQEERPDLLVTELALTPGMTVADVGAGSGYLSRRIAPRVAPGKVYAVDVQPQMVELLKGLAREPTLTNLVPVQSAPSTTNLPADSLDLAVMVDVYHELRFPLEVMQSLVHALKSGGRMVFVEYRAEDPAVPIKALHKMSEAQVRREMRHLPLDWERTSERLPVQHIIIFRKRAP